MPIKWDEETRKLNQDFPGEPPLPEKVGENNPGDNSIHKANADHSHALSFGPFFGIPFAIGWANFGGGFTSGEYTKLGNVVVLRGLVAGPNAPSTIGILPVGYRPIIGTEIYAVIGNNALARVDITTGGLINLTLGAGAFVQLSGIWFIAA